MDKFVPDTHASILETLSIPYLHDLSISNDGNLVAIVANRADWQDNKFVNHIWIYDQSTEKSSVFIDDEVGAEHARWSADSTTLAYLRTTGGGDREGKQIFVKQQSSMTGIQITNTENVITTFRWAPDGSGVYFLGSQYSKKINMREDKYGSMEYVDWDFAPSSLFFVALDRAYEYANRRYKEPMVNEEHPDISFTNPNSLIENFTVHITNFDISFDSNYIVIATAPTTLVEDQFHCNIYSFDIQNKALNLLLSDLPVVDGPVFSPDGKQICFTKYDGAGRAFENIVLQILDLSSGNITNPAQIDESIRLVRWTDRGIVVEWQNRTSKRIGLVPPKGGIIPLTTGLDCHVYGASTTNDGQNIAYLKATSVAPTEVYVNERKITNQAQYYLGKEIAKKKVITWHSSDGTEIEGIMSYPIGFTPSEQYPLLILVHGGPTWASFPIHSENRYYPLDSFTMKGFFILEPNYRGSAGYGSKFRSLNVGNLGIGDFHDISSGIDALLEEGFIDEERVGIMGWSQGGYISAFCATFSDRFKAASVGSGISNWCTYYSRTDARPFTLHYLGNTPWEERKPYEVASPITYVNQAKTPVLLQHGDQDVRVPVSNAFELYRALRDRNVESRLVIFEGMGHGSDKPSWNYAIMLQNLAWFCHYLLGTSMEEFWPE